MKQHKSYLALLAMCTALAGGYTIATTQHMNAAQAPNNNDNQATQPKIDNECDDEKESDNNNNNNSKKKENIQNFASIVKIMESFPALLNQLGLNNDTDQILDQSMVDDMCDRIFTDVYPSLEERIENKDKKAAIAKIMNKYNNKNIISKINKTNVTLKQQNKPTKNPLMEELNNLVKAQEDDVYPTFFIACTCYGIQAAGDKFKELAKTKDMNITNEEVAHFAQETNPENIKSKQKEESNNEEEEENEEELDNNDKDKDPEEEEIN